MRKLINSNLNIIIAFLFIFNVISCGGGGSSDSTSPEKQLENGLTDFNKGMDSTAENLVSLAETLDLLNTALASDDGSSDMTSKIKELVNQFDTYSDELIESLETMDQAEAGIQDLTDGTTIQPKVLVTTVVGAGLMLYGFYTFAKNMKAQSDKMIEARKQRDEAADALMNNEDGALEKFEEKREEMVEIGQEVTKELGTKVTTDLILSPLNPTSTAGVILKDLAGNKLQDGLKVMSSTEACEDGIDSSGCKIGIDETDEDGRAAVPEGNCTIVVGGKDMSRVVVEKEIPADTYTEVTVEPVDIDDAADEMLPDDTTDDNNDADDGDDSDNGDNTNDDNTTNGGLVISSAVSGEDSSTITYLVSVSATGVSSATTLTISVVNAATSNSQKTLTANGTVSWEVIVLEKDAYVTVVRSDTGDQVSLTLPAKESTYDGTYYGSAVTTYEDEECWCWDSVDGIVIYVSGTRLSGDVSGTLSGSSVSGVHLEYGLSFSGTISGSTMSGTWWDAVDGCCRGTFSLTRQ